MLSGYHIAVAVLRKASAQAVARLTQVTVADVIRHHHEMLAGVEQLAWAEQFIGELFHAKLIARAARAMQQQDRIADHAIRIPHGFAGSAVVQAQFRQRLAVLKTEVADKEIAFLVSGRIGGGECARQTQQCHDKVRSHIGVSWEDSILSGSAEDMTTKATILVGTGIVAVTGVIAVLVTRGSSHETGHKRASQPTISFVALPWSDGKSATLAWNVHGADRVTIEGEDVPVEGTKTVPLTGARYELRANGPGGGAQSAVEAAPGQGAPAAGKAELPKRGPAQPDRVPMAAQQLEVVRRVAPRYPQLARNGHVEGTVRFRALIGGDGRIRELKLIDGHPLLIAAAADAVGQWCWKPVMRYGRAVEVVTEVDVKFTLTE